LILWINSFFFDIRIKYKTKNVEQEIMMSDEMILTEENFDNEVLNSSIPVLVDFWAEWCVPCKRLTPIIEELSLEYSGRVKVMKLNVDSAPDIAARFGISGIPALYLFHKGEAVDNSVGVQPKDKIKEMMNKIL
jgi:thioredoxin 1